MDHLFHDFESYLFDRELLYEKVCFLSGLVCLCVAEFVCLYVLLARSRACYCLKAHSLFYGKFTGKRKNSILRRDELNSHLFEARSRQNAKGVTIK